MAAAASFSQEIPSRLERLDSLLDLQGPALERLYLNARTPRLEDVRGDLRGRMLTWPWIDHEGGFSRFLRGSARADWFPWKGKSFMPGEGINRVFTDRFRLFRFETRISKSKAGDFDALQLDYDLPENPPVIRSIEDEIRELEPGLWLGQAWLRVGSKARLWLWFALASK